MTPGESFSSAAHGSRSVSRGTFVRQLALLGAAVIFSLGGSYFGVFAWRESKEDPGPDAIVAEPSFRSGDYLVAYVLMSSKCRFCASDSFKTAIRTLRSTLRSAAGSRYAQVSVVGIAIDPDMGAELDYLKELGRPGEVFDEISVGGGWMNRLLSELAWRDGHARPAVPQVVLTEMPVDATAFPRHITLGTPSLLLRVVGEDAITWMNQVERGAPLPVRAASSSAPDTGSGVAR